MSGVTSMDGEGFHTLLSPHLYISSDPKALLTSRCCTCLVLLWCFVGVRNATDYREEKGRAIGCREER